MEPGGKPSKPAAHNPGKGGKSAKDHGAATDGKGGKGKGNEGQNQGNGNGNGKGKGKGKDKDKDRKGTETTPTPAPAPAPAPAPHEPVYNQHPQQYETTFREPDTYGTSNSQKAQKIPVDPNAIAATLAGVASAALPAALEFARLRAADKVNQVANNFAAVPGGAVPPESFPPIDPNIPVEDPDAVPGTIPAGGGNLPSSRIPAEHMPSPASNPGGTSHPSNFKRYGTSILP